MTLQIPERPGVVEPTKVPVVFFLLFSHAWPVASSASGKLWRLRGERPGPDSKLLVGGVSGEFWSRRRETLHQQPDFIPPEAVLLPPNESCLVDGSYTASSLYPPTKLGYWVASPDTIVYYALRGRLPHWSRWRSACMDHPTQLEKFLTQEKAECVYNSTLWRRRGRKISREGTSTQNYCVYMNGMLTLCSSLGTTI